MHITLGVVATVFLASIASAATSAISVTCRVDDRLNVTLEIENRSARAALIEGVQPYVLLATGGEQGSYWAPFTPTEPVRPLAVNEQQTLNLRGNERRRLSFSLESLKWAKLIAALWPSQEFRSVVPSGSYKVGVRGLPSAVCGALVIR